MAVNADESFNNVVAWLAPKNKTHSKSESLKNRIAVALGINGLSLLGFYKRVFIRLGLMMTPPMLHHLQQKNSYQIKRNEKCKTAAGKKKQVQRYQFNLLKKTVIATERGKSFVAMDHISQLWV